MTHTNTPAVEVTAIPDFWDQVQRAEHLFLGLDYDGTLAPFAVDPMQARPLPGALELIRDLAADGRTHVAIISGRPVAEVLALLDNPPVTVIGSHGFEYCPVGGDCVVRQPSTAQARGLLEVRTSLLARDYAHKIEIKVASVALHTRGLDPALAVAMEEEVAGEWAARAPEFGLECRRFNGGVEGYWVTGQLRVAERTSIAVALGWAPTREQADAARKILQPSAAKKQSKERATTDTVSDAVLVLHSGAAMRQRPTRSIRASRQSLSHCLPILPTRYRPQCWRATFGAMVPKPENPCDRTV